MLVGQIDELETHYPTLNKAEGEMQVGTQFQKLSIELSVSCLGLNAIVNDDMHFITR